MHHLQLFGTLAVFGADQDIPLYAVLRYWHELEGMCPMNVKRVLEQLQLEDLLQIKGCMDVVPVLSDDESFDGRFCGDAFAPVTGQFQANPVEALLRVTRSKLNQLQVEQSKEESRRKSVSADMGASQDDNGFSLQAGLHDAIVTNSKNAATRHQKTREHGLQKEDMQNLLTGYPDEHSDAKVRLVMTSEQYEQARQHLSPDAGLNPAARQRGMRAFNPETGKRGPGVEETSVVVQPDIADDAEVDRLSRVLQGTTNVFYDAYAGVGGGDVEEDGVCMGACLDDLQERRLHAHSVPKELYDDTASVTTVVMWRQSGGSLVAAVPSSQEAALQRLHATIVDAYQHAMSDRHLWHEGVEDGWYLAHIDEHLMQAGMPGIHTPQYHILKAMAVGEFSYGDFGIQERIFPYPVPPSNSDSQSHGGSSRKSTRLASRMSRQGQFSTNVRCHQPLNAVYASMINTDVLQQIGDLKLCSYLSEAFGSSGNDFDARVVILALLSEEERLRNTYSAIVRRCMPSVYMKLLVSQILAGLTDAFRAERAAQGKPICGDPPRQWYAPTWLNALSFHEAHDAALQPLNHSDAAHRLLTLCPDNLTAGSAVAPRMLRDLLFLAAEHPAPEVRSRCSSLLRNCSDEVSARVLFGALMHAARSDEQSLRAVWTDDPQTDERNTSSVSGQTGALVLSLAAGFPDLSQEHTCAYALESLIECLWASRHGHTTTPEGQADPWSTTRPSLVSTRGFDKKSSRMAFEASTRAAIQQTAQAVRPFRLELFCALRRLAREPGGRGARIVSLALLKRWARQARLPDGGTDSGVEEAADLLHVVRDCLNPGDSIGLRWCVRALPSCVLEDRGSLATLLLLALKHESAHVRREAAQQCQLMPANHHAWAAAQLASALEKHRDVPFIDAVVGACPRLPPRPPGELLQLVLTCAQSGHQEARRLLQRSPIFEATVEMSKVQGESNWVLQSLPPLEAGCSSKLVRQLAGDESWLRHDVVRSACRRGDERVARHVVALLAACSDTGDGTVRLFEALPDFAFIADDSVEELFVLATSSHPTASYVQDLLREGTTELPSPSGPHCIDRRSPEGCKRRCAAVARLVMHNLPLVLQEDDVLQAGSLIGTLRSAPKTLLLEHASHPSVEDVLRLTWRSQSLGCRRAARDFFTLGSGTSQLLSYLSSHLLAYAKEHSDEFDALDEVFTEVECLGATQGAQPPTDGVTRVPKNSLQTHEIVRVLQMLPDDLTHAGSRLLETIVIYAMKHTDIVLKETCTDIVQGTCVAEVLDIVECYIDDDTMRVAAIRLLPKNIARATGRLLQKLLSVAMTHHDAAARCASQKVLRSNMNTTAALPLLMAKMLNGSADLPFDHIIGALLCLDGASLPSVLLQPLCSLLSHTSETVCTAAYDEVAKAPTAHPDVVRELMHIVTASLEPRLTAPPSSLVLSLNRALCLLLSWGLNQHVSELDVEKLLHITTKFASTPEGDLALAILRRTKKEYSKMCLRYLLQKHSVTEPRCIAVGLPELPDIGKNDGVNTWDYGRLLQAVVPAVLERGDDWAVALAKRSTVLSAVMGSRVKTAVHELPSADTMPTRREQALQHAARAMQALPDLESLRLACCSAPEAGRLIDAVCLIADGVGEEDVLAHLKEPARSLLLPAREPSTTPPVATSSASTTQTTEQSDPQQQPQQLVLRLHPKKERPRVSWDSSVKDSRSNMKTSKKCCVFHKRREFGESDSESCSSGDEHEKRDRPTRCTRKSCVCNTTYN